ncbi:MAG: serine/threonine-protein kinase [Candidatus Obscuribacterales bacterium]|nr:serine/threonine-protein kinase [Candidatus Obscuribacterales bacterium]
MIGKILLERYRLDTLLGQGATSDVFKAFDLTLHRNVAVKLLTRSVHSTDKSYERFLREARLTSSLSHPNIVSIFDYGVFDESQPFLVTEFLDGITLQDVLDKDNHIESKRAIPIFKQIANGLAHAHAAGIVHRDVKPSNIVLISNGVETEFVKIIDFGFVRVIAPGKEMQKLTHEDSILGSAFYVSPEQCAGKMADECSDVYSLGCLMYECLTGVPPICGENLLETLHMHINTEAINLSQTREGINLPTGLESLIMRCLEKEPAKRPQTMKEINSALSACEKEPIAGAVPLAKSTTVEVAPANSSKAQTKGFKVPALVLVLLALGLGSTTMFALSGSSSVKKVDQSAPESIPKESKAVTTKAPLEPKANPKNEKAGQEVDHLVSMAQECHSQGRCDEAVQLLERSVKLSSKVFGEDSKETRARMKDLEVMYLTLGMQEEADQLMKKLNEVPGK